MKKFTILLAAFAAFAAVSCNKEIPVETPAPEVQDGFKTVTITANIEGQTKTSYDADGKFSWTKGDQISIKGSDNKFYTFTAASAGESSTFSGKIPENVTLMKHALYPAESAGIDESGNYYYTIPEYKDLTNSSSAEIPMSSYVEAGTYNFVHMTGAAFLTFTNIPDGIDAVEISIMANKVRLSGTQQIWSGTPFTFSGDEAANDSEKTFTRKVAVTDNTAQVYLPYQGEFWDSCTINITGYDESENPISLLKDKIMKGSSANVFTPCLVIPYTPLVLNNLDHVDWDSEKVVTSIVDPSAQYSQVKELKVFVDHGYMYVRLNASFTATYSGDYLDVFFSDGEGDTKAWWGWETTGTDNYIIGLSSHKGEINKTTRELESMEFVLSDQTKADIDVQTKLSEEDVYWYLTYPRTYLEPYVSSTSKIYVSFMLWNQWDPYGVIPTIKTNMLEVTLP